MEKGAATDGFVFTAAGNLAATIEAAIGDAATSTAAGAYINHNGTKVVLVSGDGGEALGNAAGTNFGVHVKQDAVKDRASGSKVAATTFGTPGTNGAAGNIALVTPANDVTKPLVYFSAPDDEQVGVATSTTLQLFFSEKVTAQNLADGITITKCQGTHTTLPLSSCSADGTATTVNPSAVGTANAAGIFTLTNAQLGGAMTAGKTYQVTIKAAAFRDTSTEGTSCASGCANDAHTFYFTVGTPPSTDSTIPTVVTSSSAVTPAVSTTGATLTSYTP